jgi:hypothetical protein
MPCGMAQATYPRVSAGFRFSVLLAQHVRSKSSSPGRDGPSRACRLKRSGETPCLFGLAPCGVYHAVRLTPDPVGSYPTVSPLPQIACMSLFALTCWKLNNLRRFIFCCTGRPTGLRQLSRTLSGTLPCGVRTFLPLPTPDGAGGGDRPAACTSLSVPVWCYRSTRRCWRKRRWGVRQTVEGRG